MRHTNARRCGRPSAVARLTHILPGRRISVDGFTGLSPLNFEVIVLPIPIVQRLAPGVGVTKP